MRGVSFPAVALLLAACASNQPQSETAARFEAMAKERRSDERFPVLVPLPGSDQVVGEGIPAETGERLRASAAELAATRRAAFAADPGLSTAEVVVQLKEMVAALRSSSLDESSVDVGDIDFPVPPPLED